MNQIAHTLKAMAKIFSGRPSESVMRNKLKHFKPTLTKGFWSNTVTWEERETPLTDEQIKELYGL